MNSTADGSGYFLYHSIGMFPGKEALIAAGLLKYAHLWSVPDDSQWPQALAIRGAQILEVTERNSAGDGVSELAHVARPRVVVPLPEKLGRQTCGAQLAAELQ